MKVFIDFDDVLFYSKKFIQDEKKIFRKYKISEELFQKHYYQYRKDKKGNLIRIYNLKKQLRGIKKEKKMDIEPIRKELEVFLKDTGKYIFNDVENFLKKFEKKNLFIISYSKTDFQKNKIKNSGIPKYFKKIIITDEEKFKALKRIIDTEKTKNEEIFFLEDRTDYIAGIKNEIPWVKTILMRRPQGRYKDEVLACCDFRIKNLKEAEKIINKCLRKGR
ncbi:MAG: hypothetical protein COZ85_03005 [Candidatus Moranbacteria bacterium CG_4_8_14_3_um_filter_34_16]|nr:MAG: hypothetical protein COT31_00405 [Candidatus Moranbacteria bacterium CG08_land_8_20_14_0_20_34_16]PIW94854.1 MAG: hypothetical protein COZ85_03005 [Candidatus Moranbacteria bacterium CG_4_8_14_3_um_filter_34_16]PJA89154.1 MAG: hypothetical protein CO138_02005 [Candidatus Moranbacteria bacterium CG_4_9_14_3_um_filter_33_15]